MGKTEFLKASEEGLAQASALLKRSGVVAVPTETVYGLGAIATDETAVLKIFQAKERPLFDPLIVHVPKSWKTLADLQNAHVVEASKIPPAQQAQIEKLMHAFWPGPLTLILPRGSKIPDLVTSALDTVGVRMPKHELTLRLLDLLNEGLAAPSANRFGRVSPTDVSHVLAELDGRIDAVLDGGRCTVGVESTIVAVDAQGVRCLRPGGIPVEEIEKVLGVPVKKMLAPALASTASSAPGMLADHYSPVTPLRLFSREDLVKAVKTGFASLGVNAKKTAVLFLQEQETVAFCPEIVQVRSLSQKRDFETAARNLFATLRDLDALGVELIAAERCDETEGLGFAVGDRLRRAEHKRKS